MKVMTMHVYVPAEQTTGSDVEILVRSDLVDRFPTCRLTDSNTFFQSFHNPVSSRTQFIDVGHIQHQRGRLDLAYMCMVKEDTVSGVVQRGEENEAFETRQGERNGKEIGVGNELQSKPNNFRHALAHSTCAHTWKEPIKVFPQCTLTAEFPGDLFYQQRIALFGRDMLIALGKILHPAFHVVFVFFVHGVCNV